MKLPVNYRNLGPYEKRPVREEYMRVQKGECYYCKGLLVKDPPKEILDKEVTPKLYPRGFFNHPVHLHHDHQTDMTLGAVHCYCNAVLWEYHNE